MADILTEALGGSWQASIYSWLSSGAMLIFGLLLCGGLVYILFLRKKTRKWGVIIWEPKENGLLIPASVDILDEKYFGGGMFGVSKQVAYILRKLKVEVFPPNQKTIYRKNGKDWCDYVRIQQEYIPVSKQIKYGLDKFDKDEYLWQLKQLTKQKPQEVQSQYIYAPLVAAPRVEFDIELMDHDVNMMRMAAIDNRDKVYADKKSFMEKYAPTIGLALLIVAFIVIAYLSFDFIVKYQSSMIAPLQNIADGLRATATSCQPVTKIANSPPV